MTKYGNLILFYKKKLKFGEVAEWFKATVSNTVWAKVLQGSNPCLSAK